MKNTEMERKEQHRQKCLNDLRIMNSIWTMKRLYYAIVDLCANLRRCAPSSKIELETASLYGASKVKYERIVAVMKSFGMVEDGYHDPVNSFSRGVFCQNNEVAHVMSEYWELISADCENLTKYIERNLESLLLEQNDVTQNYLFSTLFCTRVDAEAFCRRFDDTGGDGIGLYLGVRASEQILFRPIRSICRSIDAFLLSLLGREDMSISVDELKCKYGYPDMSDSELRELTLWETC